MRWSFGAELYRKLIFGDAMRRSSLAFAFHLLSPTAREAGKPTIKRSGTRKDRRSADKSYD
jgi:hypothetical protein